LPRHERLYLAEIKQALVNIFELVSEAADLEAPVVQAAVFWNLTVIGEAVRALPDDVKEREPDVRWSDAVGMRNVLVHAYFGIELEQVWRTITVDLPVLEAAVDRLSENSS
jgi:uncharacterized protein with HEPN domain